jgi:hypothetical protein
MRLREVVSGRSAFAWQRRCARSTSWLRELSDASARLAGYHLPDFARRNAPVFGTCLTELTNVIADDVPPGGPAQALRRRMTRPAETRPADRRADEGRKAWLSRALPAGEAAQARPSRPASRPRASATAPLLATLPQAVSSSRLATLADDVPRAWPGPSRAGQRGVRRSVPMPGAAAAESGMLRSGAAPMAGAGTAPIAGVGAKKVPDPAAASTILGRRVNARAGYALADAFGPALRARRPPLSHAVGWAGPIAGPTPGLVLIDADPPLLPPEPGAGSRKPPEHQSRTTTEPRSRTAAEPGPGRPVTAQPTVPSPANSAVPQTEPVLAGQAPQATAHREDLKARNGHAAEIDVTADTASAALDPPTTAAHLGALTALDRRQGYLPAVAAPLSVSESRAEERHRFDPVEFAEHVRVALIDDARRHGIGV